jgi:hypothetical protein
MSAHDALKLVHSMAREKAGATAVS